MSAIEKKTGDSQRLVAVVSCFSANKPTQHIVFTMTHKTQDSAH